MLPGAPSVAPGRIAPDPPSPLDLARQRWVEGDAAGTVTALAPWLGSKRGPSGRVRTAGHLLMGEAQMRLGNWNLASAHFSKVRATGGPLAPYGAWYEALVDHERGRHLVAVRECAAYREKWPEGPHADECLLLAGDAWSAQGNRGAAVHLYQQYVEKHPDTPRDEEIRVAIALATLRTDPKKAVPLVIELWLSHAYPSTDLAAQAAIRELAELGIDVRLPDDPKSRMRRAESLRRSGKLGEAWELFGALAARAADDPEVARWVEENEDRFAWGTRQYDVYADAIAARYEREPDPDAAWSIFLAWSRAGEQARASAWGRKGLEKHGGHWRWKGAKDEVAWAAMLAGEYLDARDRFADLAARGGDFGKKCAFYSAFSAWRGGDLPGARAGFDALVARRGDLSAAAHYWRARVREAEGDAAGAVADRERAVALDDTGWYALLLSPAGERDGTWAGEPPVVLAPFARPEVVASTSAGLWPSQAALVETPWGHRPGLEAPAPRSGLGALTWDRLRAGGAPAGDPVTPTVEVLATHLDLPSGYEACQWYDPAEARATLARAAAAHEDVWPDLQAAHDLAIAGLYNESARLVFDAFEEWRDVRTAGAGGDPRRARIAASRLTMPDWRAIVLFTQDHYHAARACYGLDREAQDDPSRLVARRLAFPIVRAPELWAYGQAHDVDPYLILGIMRQESTYRNAALSPAGAVGLLQVMPSTGAKIAALLGEHRYSPGDLEDPAVNLEYGTYYFSRLMRRFDNVFPLAVASYNGGPHNLSRWYRPWRENIDMDAFVEQIQYDESRDYVKKVAGYYARYVEIYEPGERVALPRRPAGDHAEIVDF